MLTPLRRSALYMPASNARAIEKAKTLPCDVVILDLEDAVAPESKALAREQALDAVRRGGFGERQLVVRCNDLASPYGEDDCKALALAKPDAVLAPKVSSVQDLKAYRSALGGEGGPALWAMIETCAVVFELRELSRAAVSCGLQGFVLGTNDLVKELGCEESSDRIALQPIFSLTVAAARLAGLFALDGVCNALQDAAALEAECRQARAFGFDGKTLIHPAQIKTTNRMFSPGEAALNHARAVLAAFAAPENHAKGVVRVDGRMVERLRLAQAERVIALAQAAAREPGR